MTLIAGYKIIEQLYESDRSLVYRCEEPGAIPSQPVIIKLHKGEHPSLNELVQFRNQYAIPKNLDLPEIVKPIRLENYRNSFVLVMEDNGGVSLSEYFLGKSDKFFFTNTESLSEFIHIAIQIAQALEGLHNHRIIHKDIQPQNILINPETKQIKLIDFSISSLLPRESQEITNPNILEGTLAYISPEQTGRMNRGIDYRTDFYSLGVTFYELLTGQLPFQSNDAMELVHCHIARMPTPPIEINPAIGQVLNDIVIKLMAKTAEDRYQTALGLRADLSRCLVGSAKGSIAFFELATRDISERFTIPEKLYGREAEVETLLEAFNRVSLGSTEMMLVAGASGIGKTAVVNEVHKPIVSSRGYFITGKFDQFQRDMPFSAWVQALQNLMRQLLTESAASVEGWKANLLSALGKNGQVIIDVIPELEILIGKQPPVPELEGSATQNRFNLLFEKFIRVFTTREHPLVIFLDDVQWADAASLKLMQTIISDTSGGYLLLIVAYRDNEVLSGHPFMLTLNEIRKANAKVNEIILVPLHELSLNCLIADALSCAPEMAGALTELVAAKTKGNPFFANQLLKSLYQEGLIYFAPPVSPAPPTLFKGWWQFDITKVNAFFISDDVVEFMAAKLQKLPETTQSVLKLAACIGNSFDLDTVALVYEKSQAETAAALWKALQEGLIIPQREDYKFFQNSGEVEVGKVSELSVYYKFLHDRVQQAAYSLLSDDSKQLTHLIIGRLLLSNTPTESREEKIFDIVNQLNFAVELLTTESEKEELAQLNLVAGLKAIASTASAAAMKYLTVAIGLLAPSCWQTQYDLSLTLYESAATAASLSGDFERTERLADIVLQQAKSLSDKVKIYETKIKAYTAQEKILEAINTGLAALALVGVDLPHKPTMLDLQQGMQETASILSEFSIEELIDLPPMLENNKLVAMCFLYHLASPAVVYNVNLSALITLKKVNLSVQYGNAVESTLAYAQYGIILCSFGENINDGYKFGSLALSLVELSKSNAEKSLTVFPVLFVNCWIKHWKEHPKTTLENFLNNYYLAYQNGHIDVAAVSVFLYCYTEYVTGKELRYLLQDMANYANVITSTKYNVGLSMHLVYYQTVINLVAPTHAPALLIGEVYDERNMLQLHIKTNHEAALGHLYSQKLILSYLFNNYWCALENSEKTEKYLGSLASTITEPIFHFYDSLVQLAVYPELVVSEQQQKLKKVAANQRKMKEWAHHAPMNYLHKYYLVEAERYRVLGDVVAAMEYYDLAIAGAKENEYIQEESLANELAAKFYLGLGREKIASLYLTDAYYGYFRWGALAKVDALEKRYPQLLAAIEASKTPTLNSSERVSATATGKITSRSTGISEDLDLATVIEASQAISKEINLEQLLSTLMRVALENAGASFGALILHDEGNLTLEATAVVSDLTKQVTQTAESLDAKLAVNLLPSLPVVEGEIAVSAINYVARTQEILVVNDATVETMLANDPYIIAQQPKSLLCTPILNQGKLVGILYLENNLTVKAFTPDRLEILKIISYQAAIAIDNARLYNNLEEKVTSRTQELAQALEHLKATQQELIQSEKMAALGQLVAGIAHEVNTPIGAIRASISNLLSALSSSLEQLPKLLQQLSPAQIADFMALIDTAKNNQQYFSSREERQLRKSLKKELETHGLSDADTLADTLVPMGITTDITRFLPLLQDTHKDLILEVAQSISSQIRNSANILQAVERASKIVFALKSYAHQDSSGNMVKANIASGIDIVLTLYENQLKQGVEVFRNYQLVPETLCYPEQLNQVWTNLIHNAIQAMNNRGQLEIKVFEQAGQIVVQMTDSGCGITPEILPRIFEPFFTTKPAGEGSGLGLDIVRKIIDLHQGKIEVESEPGRTTFSVRLPIL